MAIYSSIDTSSTDGVLLTWWGESASTCVYSLPIARIDPEPPRLSPEVNFDLTESQWWWRVLQAQWANDVFDDFSQWLPWSLPEPPLLKRSLHQYRRKRRTLRRFKARQR